MTGRPSTPRDAALALAVDAGELLGKESFGRSDVQTAFTAATRLAQVYATLALADAITEAACVSAHARDRERPVDDE